MGKTVGKAGFSNCVREIKFEYVIRNKESTDALLIEFLIIYFYIICLQNRFYSMVQSMAMAAFPEEHSELDAYALRRERTLLVCLSFSRSPYTGAF